MDLRTSCEKNDSAKIIKVED
ncbi:hypothetical protein NPIL_459121, partial [Nephila pilipes]